MRDKEARGLAASSLWLDLAPLLRGIFGSHGPKLYRVDTTITAQNNAPHLVWVRELPEATA